MAVVGMDSANPAGCKKYDLGALVRHPRFDRLLTGQVKLASVRGDDLAVLRL
jgi:hypothetical protein